MNAEKITQAAADYIARNPRRFPNPPAALNVYGNAADGARPERLPRFFTVRRDGKFDFPPLNKLFPVTR